jgi:hypothetical protein
MYTQHREQTSLQTHPCIEMGSMNGHYSAIHDISSQPISSLCSLLDLIFSRCYSIWESRESTSNMQRNILASVAFRCKVRTYKQIGQRDTNRQRLLLLEEYIHSNTHTIHNTLSSVAANDRLSIMYKAESSSSNRK